jgi:ferredoxin
VAEPDERTIGGLRIRIDRGLCVGFGDCIEAAPEAFVLDGEGVCVFTRPEAVARERLLAACEACPVDALTVWDESGQQVVPSPNARGAEGGPDGASGPRRT